MSRPKAGITAAARNFLVLAGDAPCASVALWQTVSSAFSAPSNMRNMSLARKLNLKDGMKMRVVGTPAGVDLDDVVGTSAASAEDVWSAVRFRPKP